MAITFQIQEIGFTIRGKTALRQWIKAVVRSEGLACGDITYVFTNDDVLLDYNRKYLDHDTLTDIITFDYSATGMVSGDILISIDRVRENAMKFGITTEKELARVMIHGVLHLCGYKDKTRKQSEEMRAMEDRALRKFTVQKRKSPSGKSAVAEKRSVSKKR